jgi:hypothetical protein
MLALQNDLVRFFILRRLWELQLKPSDLCEITGMKREIITGLSRGDIDISDDNLRFIADCLHLRMEKLPGISQSKQIDQLVVIPQSVWVARKLCLQVDRAILEQHGLWKILNTTISNRRRILRNSRLIIDELQTHLTSDAGLCWATNASNK